MNLKLIFSITFFGILIGNPETSAAGLTGALNSCTKNEKWQFEKTPKPLRELMEGYGHSKGDAMEALLSGYSLKMKDKSPEAQYLAEYTIYRAYYDLNLLNLSHRGFAALLVQSLPPQALGIKIAALGCLNQIHEKIPMLRIPVDSLRVFSQLDPSTSSRLLSPDQRQTLVTAAVSVGGRKVAEMGSRADLTLELQLARMSAPHLLYLHGILASLQGQPQEAADALSKLLKVKKLPPSLESQRDSLYLSLGRNYYNLRQYKKALIAFRKVSHESNFLVPALRGMGWSHLMMNESGKAVGAAYNLLLGELRSTFVPDADIIAGITLLENCHHEETLQSIRHFHRSYDRSYQWLYHWYYNKNNARQNYDLYQITLNAILKKPMDRTQRVPKNVVSEWVRSPLFKAGQLQINQLIEERSIIPSLVKELMEISSLPKIGNSKLEKSSIDRLRIGVKSILLDFLKQTTTQESQVIAAINHELGFINRYLISLWLEAFENGQLIEVESLSKAGETIVRKYNTSTKKAVLKKTAEGEELELPELDWGGFSMENEEKAETWEDEVGYLKLQVDNLCDLKKK